MRPNFKNIDIANEAFNVEHKPLKLAEPWKTPSCSILSQYILAKTLKVWNTLISLLVFLHSLVALTA